MRQLTFFEEEDKKLISLKEASVWASQIRPSFKAFILIYTVMHGLRCLIITD